ncbi:MAG: indole-3-glycerol phosphate synthase TrpC [bacterium]|nr:indole-3-glycerol phosphate synthase TrpC [bacterium]
MKMLKDFISSKQDELLYLKKLKSLKQIQDEAFELQKKYKPRNFTAVFADRNSIKLIAEIKLASPSHGLLTHLSYIDLAKIYAESVADAVSVLTEKKYFNGDLKFLREVKNIIPQPILRKDFIIDEYQVYETFLAGADAFLLIAAILTKKQLSNFISLGKKFKLAVLVEIHNKEDLAKTLSCGGEMIGINNRDLKTMKIDLTTSERLVTLIPSGKIVVSESGINTAEDVQYVKNLGINGILVGSSIVKAADSLKKIIELKSI